MGFLSSITDTLFGDNGKAASDKQSRENELNRSFIREGIAEGRADIERLYPGVNQARQEGFSAAKDIFAQTAPQAFDLFQQGNRAAQRTTAAAPQQQYNARMGMPVDFSFLQPQAPPTADFSFLQPKSQAQGQQQNQPQDVNAMMQSPDFLKSLGIDITQFYQGNGPGGQL